MGRYITEAFDPELLELPNDTDFELEGIDESYGFTREYEAYLPDKIGDLVPLSPETLAACASAEQGIAKLAEALASHPTPDACAEELLLAEAVATTRAENYVLSRESLLDYAARKSRSAGTLYQEAEEAALDALEALRAFAPRQGAVTLDELCATNATFARTSGRQEFCGSLRERPVFIGGSLFDADYVAPPSEELEPLMEDLVAFVNADDELSPVAKAAIVQVQLVTIHPFEDGNGRMSRALSQRVLQESGITRGLILPVTSAAIADKHDYVDAIESLVNGRGPADPNRFVTFFARMCAEAAHLALANHA